LPALISYYRCGFVELPTLPSTRYGVDQICSLIWSFRVLCHYHVTSDLSSHIILKLWQSVTPTGGLLYASANMPLLLFTSNFIWLGINRVIALDMLREIIFQLPDSDIAMLIYESQQVNLWRGSMKYQRLHLRHLRLVSLPQGKRHRALLPSASTSNSSRC